MGFEDLLWRNNVEPPTFAIGDEVLYWKSAIKDSCIVSAVRTTQTMDGEDTYQEVMVEYHPYWLPASQFVRVRKIT